MLDRSNSAYAHYGYGGEIRLDLWESNKVSISYMHKHIKDPSDFTAASWYVSLTHGDSQLRDMGF